MAIEIVDGEDTLKSDNGLQKYELETRGLQSGPLGLVLTEEKFIMHQTHSAASMLCSHNREKEWREWSFVYDDDMLKRLASY